MSRAFRDPLFNQFVDRVVESVATALVAGGLPADAPLSEVLVVAGMELGATLALESPAVAGLLLAEGNPADARALRAALRATLEREARA